jgi:hypothetical protein
MIEGGAVNRCPNLDSLERHGEEVAAHLARCAPCRALLELMNPSALGGTTSADCARAEILIAAGANSPLSEGEGAFLPAHLARCSACRQAALEPPSTSEGELPEVDPSRYLLGAEIGRGGMGRVIAARDVRIGRVVALKEVLSDEPLARSRFEREARITAGLQHPGIVSIHEVGRWPDGRPFYAMPILPGRSLGQAIAAAPGLRERLRLLPALIAAVDAVAYAHSRGVIHRDLTPSNIVLGDFGETIVIDWGLAKILEGGPAEPGAPPADASARSAPAGGLPLTMSGTVMGTPSYFAPEQAQGLPVDARADVFALGAILRHLLAGRPPHDGLGAATIIDGLRSPRGPQVGMDRDPAIPPDLLSVVRQASADEPAARYATARDLADDLRRYQAGDRVGAHHYTPRALASRWLSRRLPLVALFSVMVTLLAVTAAIGVYRVFEERKRVEETSEQLDRVRGRLLSQQVRDREDPIEGWQGAGLRPEEYAMGLDPAVTWNGRPSAHIRARLPATSGFATLSQAFTAKQYRGKRLRFAAHVRSRDLRDEAGLWMRVDGKEGAVLSVDNSDGRTISGTTDWTRREVVLDVDSSAEVIGLGLWVNDLGSVWLNGVVVEVVDRTVPITAIAPSSLQPPQNLDFSKGVDETGVPIGWVHHSPVPSQYEVGLDPKLKHRGASTAYLRSSTADGGFATLVQAVDTSGLTGRRLRLSAEIKAHRVADWAGLWMRVNGQHEILAFDNMSDRPIRGTIGWRRYQVVLDVSRLAGKISFGVLLHGRGDLRISHVDLETVGDDVPLTVEIENGPVMPDQPVNLDLQR